MAHKKEIGFLGELDREIAQSLGIEPLMVFELSVDALAQIATQRIDYRPLPQYPEAVRDISVDMPAQTFAASVVDAVGAADEMKLIRSFEVPDAPYDYPGGETKNILFRFHLRSDKKTLDAKEIGDWQKNSIAAIEKNPDWKVKK